MELNVSTMLFVSSLLTFTPETMVYADKPGDPTPAMQTSENRPDSKQAKKAYTEAQKLFRAEEYKLALPLFKKAYELSNRKPTSIMGLAQCERMLEMYDEAILHFQEYIKTKPSLRQQKRVNETLKILREHRTQAKADQAERARKAEETAKKTEILRRKEAELLAEKAAIKMATQANEKESESIWSNPWLWVGLGFVVAGAAAGTGYILAPGDDLYGGTSDQVFRP